jgi:surface antigen
VPFARRETGVEIHGDANTWWAQAAGRYARTDRPSEGAVVVLHGFASANRGHVGVVRERVSERMVIIDHANWLNAGEITRNVPVRDVSPNNDWSQVQVWHVPGRHWGGRTYTVQGFILNLLDQAPDAAAAAAVAG